MNNCLMVYCLSNSSYDKSKTVDKVKVPNFQAIAVFTACVLGHSLNKIVNLNRSLLCLRNGSQITKYNSKITTTYLKGEHRIFFTSYKKVRSNDF